MNYTHENIEYIEGDEEYLDLIGSLWEKLNNHHIKKSIHFKEKFRTFTFEMRKKGLLEKAKEANFYINLAKDKRSNIYIGYCLTTLSNENLGEIESIYLEPDYRGIGIGDKFMKNSLKWLKNNFAKSIRLGVAAGNGDAVKFYTRYGFFPKVTILEKTDNNIG